MFSSRWPRALLSAVLWGAVAMAHAAGPASGQRHASASAPRDPCRLFLPRLPGVDRDLCASLELRESGARSVRGIPLFTRDIGSAGSPLRVLVAGAIHGDEMSSASLAMQWIRFAHEQGGPNFRAVHWRFVPVLNPDGLLAKPPKRVNASGVDLNRNFPTPGWEQEAPIYWTHKTGRDPRRWPGPRPLSEPESRFLHAQMTEFKPHLIVSIHAPYGVLDFDGPAIPPPRLGRLYLDQVGIFPGSLGNYGGVHKGVPVVTIELTDALRAPKETEARQMWADLQGWITQRLASAGNDTAVR